jgi:hypothetical protein
MPDGPKLKKLARIRASLAADTAILLIALQPSITSALPVINEIKTENCNAALAETQSLSQSQ